MEAILKDINAMSGVQGSFVCDEEGKTLARALPEIYDQERLAEAGDRSEGLTALRVVDAGDAAAFRSQALWHGIASAMRPGGAPTLSFCRPTEPYVGLGYHRSLAEIDSDACRRLGLPVIRRRIGGGPVYLDSDQLFFQITLPADRAPARVDRLYELCLEPAAHAFRALGLAARRHGANDITIGDTETGTRKLSGTGAGRIGDGVTVVGNVMFRFPHERMVEVLALPNDRLRRECLRLMRHHVSSLADEGLEGIGFGAARAALVEAYGRAFGANGEGRASGAQTQHALTEVEEAAIREWEERFRDPEWLAGPQTPGPCRPVARQIKISADAWIVTAAGDGVAVEASIVGGRLQRVVIEAPGLAGEADEIARVLVGRRALPGVIERALEPFSAGGRILELLSPALTPAVSQARQS